jgi:hypothetical protein
MLWARGADIPFRRRGREEECLCLRLDSVDHREDPPDRGMGCWDTLHHRIMGTGPIILALEREEDCTWAEDKAVWAWEVTE